MLRRNSRKNACFLRESSFEPGFQPSHFVLEVSEVLGYGLGFARGSGGEKLRRKGVAIEPVPLLRAGFRGRKWIKTRQSHVHRRRALLVE